MEQLSSQAAIESPLYGHLLATYPLKVLQSYYFTYDLFIRVH